jgi:hypothetical protein
MSRVDNPGKGWKGVRVGPDPADESEHFYVYKRCGQAVDMRGAFDEHRSGQDAGLNATAKIVRGDHRGMIDATSRAT